MTLRIIKTSHPRSTLHYFCTHQDCDDQIADLYIIILDSGLISRGLFFTFLYRNKMVCTRLSISSVTIFIHHYSRHLWPHFSKTLQSKQLVSLRSASNEILDRRVISVAFLGVSESCNLSTRRVAWPWHSARTLEWSILLWKMAALRIPGCRKKWNSKFDRILSTIWM